jgi:hypothetical protein
MNLTTTHRNPEARKLKHQLDDSGRSVAWLAKQTGYSRNYLYKVFNGTLPETTSFVVRVGEAMELQNIRTMEFHGRTVRLPKPVYNRLNLPGVDRMDELERAWKEAWVKEEGQAWLAVGAERAWQRALGLAGASA